MLISAISEGQSPMLDVVHKLDTITMTIAWSRRGSGEHGVM